MADPLDRPVLATHQGATQYQARVRPADVLRALDDEQREELAQYLWANHPAADLMDVRIAVDAVCASEEQRADQ